MSTTAHAHRRSLLSQFLPLVLVLSLRPPRAAAAWNLADPSLDHYTRAIHQVGAGDYLRGIETGRAAARHAGKDRKDGSRDERRDGRRDGRRDERRDESKDESRDESRDAWVNLAGFYLHLFNKEDYHKPVSHVQALELFAIAHHGMARWPDFHGSIRNMESALRWLCSSAQEEAGLKYDKTLDGTNTWRLPPLQSTGDRLAAVQYGLEHAPSAEIAVLNRGPLFIPRPYQSFRRDKGRESARIDRLQRMAKRGRGQHGKKQWQERERSRRREMQRRREMRRRREMQQQSRRRPMMPPKPGQQQRQRQRQRQQGEGDDTNNDL